jgi:hypothetical protein
VAISSQGTTFTFTGISAFSPIETQSSPPRVTSISIEEAQPEVVDMTGVSDLKGSRRRVWTGDITSPAKISIEYFRTKTEIDGYPLVTSTGATGQLVISNGSFSVDAAVAVESSSTEIAVGDGVRGRMSFVVDKEEVA